MKLFKTLTTFFLALTLAHSTIAQEVGDVSDRETTVKILSKLMPSLDSLNIVNHDLKQDTFGGLYPADTKLSYAVADLLLEKTYEGPSEVSANDKLVDRYSIENNCTVSAISHLAITYTCIVSRFAQSYRIDENTGEEIPAWDDGTNEGWADMIEYKAIKSVEEGEVKYRIDTNSPARFIFAG